MRIDCRGLTADEVMAEGLRRAAAAPEPLSVIQLDNVRWAGPLLTSSDPELIATVVRPGLAAELGIAVEVTVPPEARTALPRELPAVDGLSPEAVRAALAAVAGLERRGAPVGVWREVAQGLAAGHGPVPLAGLRAVAEALPGLLVLDGEENVRFTDDAAHHAAREAFALSAADQETITGVLRRLWPEHPAYVSWALPVHAALAGVLPELLTDAAFVARAHWYAVWQGMVQAWPEGVPADCLASDLHYLRVQGVRPAAQGEWVAWVHHAAVSRGDTAFADALAAAAGPLPWRTLWSRWRLPGKPGAQPEVGWVDGLSVHGHGEGWAVADHRDSPEELRGWDAVTGEPLDAGQPWADSEPAPGVTYAVNRSRGWELRSEPVAGVPRAPRTVGKAVRPGRSPAARPAARPAAPRCGSSPVPAASSGRRWTRRPSWRCPGTPGRSCWSSVRRRSVPLAGALATAVAAVGRRRADPRVAGGGERLPYGRLPAAARGADPRCRTARADAPVPVPGGVAGLARHRRPPFARSERRRPATLRRPPGPDVGARAGRRPPPAARRRRRPGVPHPPRPQQP